MSPREAITPQTIVLGDNPITDSLIGTLGRAELEFTFALIVRWHQVKKLNEWVSVSRTDITELFQPKPDELVSKWGRNPFWKPDPFEFAEAGFITWGTRPDEKGELTDVLFDRIKAEWVRREIFEKLTGRKV